MVDGEGDEFSRNNIMGRHFSNKDDNRVLLTEGCQDRGQNIETSSVNKPNSIVRNQRREYMVKNA